MKNIEWEISGYNGTINYESLFDRTKSDTKDSKIECEDQYSTNNYNSHNLENLNTFNILPKYQPFSQRFKGRADKIKNLANENKKRPPVPSSFNPNKIALQPNKLELRESQSFNSDSFTSDQRYSDWMSKYQNSNFSASNSSSLLINTASSPKMDFYNQSKKISEEMRSKVMNMIEARHKESKAQQNSNLLPPKIKQSRNSSRDQKLLLSSVQSQNYVDPRYSYGSTSKLYILNCRVKRVFISKLCKEIKHQRRRFDVRKLELSYRVNWKAQPPRNSSLRASSQSQLSKEQNRSSRAQDKRIDQIYENSRKIWSEKRPK